jgi:hypothetical protein
LVEQQESGMNRPECVPPNDPDLAVVPESFLRAYYDLIIAKWGLDRSIWMMQLQQIGGTMDKTPESSTPRAYSRKEQMAWDDANRTMDELTRRLARASGDAARTIRQVKWELKKLGERIGGGDDLDK